MPRQEQTRRNSANDRGVPRHDAEGILVVDAEDLTFEVFKRKAKCSMKWGAEDYEERIIITRGYVWIRCKDHSKTVPDDTSINKAMTLQKLIDFSRK
ncbi:hypothetical protein DPMN_193299 [Dreissena polymorpha]|uniref:Uncharacterized protein n=1 Tax=Dreissena polymorpha TaxID=45954 RepID=A0A9D3Y316_DREPO|nr:hypothetical protein DPMN_193299 [Dreissena polymorpha]